MSETIRLAGEILNQSLVNGEGCRMVIFCQGCLHNCKGCFNPQTHDVNAGLDYDIKDIESAFDKNIFFLDGITLSGGDPLLQAHKLINLCKYVKSKNKTIWCYTGYTYDYLIENANDDNKWKEFLDNIDVLVDGEYIEELNDGKCKFRGSSNQRIIDLNKTRNNLDKVIYLLYN